ncbi:hypothetical protein [Aliarcobacter butzleri]|uniref:hypothetical protein n=2 Tax=Aliarcobacter butzleri TaxID=28197 RepID=UPI003AF850D0
MTEKIENILLLKTEVLSYARSLKTNDRKIVESLFKLFDSENKYQFDDKEIDALLNFINKINEKSSNINEDEFKKRFIEKIKLLLSKNNIEKETPVDNTKDLRNKLEKFEDKFSNYISTLDEIRDVSQFYENIHENMLSLDQKINDVEEKEKILKNIKEYNEKEIAKNNFDLLSTGFSNILEEKKNKLNNLLDLLNIFGVVILLIPIFIILADIYHWKILFHTSSIIALVTIELFVIYFFKIFLHNYNEVKEQILQIDNKQVLLGFISNYLKFKDLNSITDSSIVRLEEIIFSRISPDIKQGPTAPDIASIVEKVLKAFKG